VLKYKNSIIFNLIIAALILIGSNLDLLGKPLFDLNYKGIFRDWKEFDPYTGIEERRSPLYQYLSVNFDYNENASFYTDLFFEKDLSSGDSADYEIYSGYLDLRTASKKYEAKIGRHMINPGFHLVTIDGLTLSGNFTENLEAELYGGIPEFFEDDYKRYEIDNSREDDYSAGIKLILVDYFLNRGTLNFYAEQENDREKRNISASIYKTLLKNYIAIDSMAEYEDEVERITNFRGALNFYPTSNLTLGARFSFYEPVNYDWEIKDENLDDVSVFNILSWHEKSTEHAFTMQYNLSDNITLFDEFAYVNYVINENDDEENARRFVGGVNLDFNPDLALSSYFKYFYYDTRTGNLNGCEVNLFTTFVNILDVGLTLSGAWFDKLNPNLISIKNYTVYGDTYTVELYSKVDIYKGLYTSITLEESYNDDYKDNLRFTAKVGYDFSYGRE
jgi:hypothetical protein